MKVMFKISIVVAACLAFSTTAVFAANDTTQALSDTAITAKVKTKLLADRATHGTAVNITTHNGIVAITGEVDSKTEASNIVQTAEATHGVKDVDASNLTVKGSDQPFTDAGITAKVKGLFIKEKVFDKADVAAMTIHVETKDGVVYLSGTADNTKQAKNAEKFAKSVNGVTKVENTVTVGKKEAAK